MASGIAHSGDRCSQSGGWIGSEPVTKAVVYEPIA